MEHYEWASVEWFSELISEKYEEMHRSLDGMGIKTLDFYVKKKTDHYNNLINTYVRMNSTPSKQYS